MWNLYQLAQDSRGDEKKIRAGLAGAAPSLVPLLGMSPAGPGLLPPGLLPPGLPPPGLPPPVFPPPPFAPPVFTPPTTLPPVTPVPIGPGPAVGAGLGVEGAIMIGGITAIVAVCVISAVLLWQIGEFQEGLRQRGLIILDDPLAVCIGGCHQSGRPMVDSFPLPREDPFRAPRDLLDPFRESRTEPAPSPQPVPVTEPQKEENTEKRTCATAYPGVRLCDSLPPEFIYASPQAALNALKVRTGDPSLRLTSAAPSQSGPCPGTGTHYGVKSGGTYVASISCCPCCRDTAQGPVLLTRCRII
jgi:hypothetical protein